MIQVYFEDNQVAEPLLETEYFVSHCQMTSKENASFVVENGILHYSPLQRPTTLFPFVIPPLEYSEENFIKITYFLMSGILEDPDLETKIFEPNSYYSEHNMAVLNQYHWVENALESEATEKYIKAISIAPTQELQAFSLKQLIYLLLEKEEVNKARLFYQSYLSQLTSDSLKIPLSEWDFSLKTREFLHSGNWDNTLPQQAETLLQHYQKHDAKEAVVMLYEDLASVYQKKKDFKTAETYIQKAYDLLNKEEFPEWHASLLLNQMKLYLQWALEEEASYLHQSIRLAKEAMPFFNPTDFPVIYAQLQHQLGIIYAEVMDEPQKRSMWSAFSSNAFTRAMDFFNKENYPIEYAKICNNYGHALMKYPDFRRSDNFEKALYYFKEALEIQDAGLFPRERARTLLNYVEACWMAGNENAEDMELRKEDIQQKSEEVLSLSDEEELRSIAQEYLQNLEKIQL